jgi:hypothetical protein
MRYMLDVPHGASVELLLFTNVNNTQEFMKQVLSRELDVAALDAELVRWEIEYVLCNSAHAILLGFRVRQLTF